MSDQRRGPFLTDEMEKVKGKMKVRITWGEETLGVVSFEYKVCPTCRGKGSHVNPSIDEHGMSEREMARRGPEFREQYFSGAYDQRCNQCEGENVVPKLTPCGEEEEEIVQEFLRRKESTTRSREIQRQERRMAMGRGMR